MPFSFKRSITVQGSQVPGTLTNFPMLFSGTYTYLRTVANGGQVQSASGFDIVFYADEALTVKLDHEIDFWSGSTGVIQAWIRIPSLAGGTDTTIWLAYGDNTINTSQQNRTAVWDSNHILVAHLGDGTTLSGADSTSNNNNLTAVNLPTAVSGKISGGVNLVRTSFQRMHRAAPATPSQYTIGAWVLSPAAPGSTLVTQPIGIGSESFGLSWDHNNTSFRAAFWHRNNAGGYLPLTLGAMVGNTYYHLFLTWDGTTARAYRDGTQQSSTSISNVIGFSGNYGIVGGSNAFGGIVDEFRYSNTARSANWILTEFRNQNTPSTFYAVGNEAPVQAIKIKKITEKNISEIKAVGGTAKTNIKKIGGINKN